MQVRALLTRMIAYTVLGLLTGCDDDDKAPVATPMHVNAIEDQLLRGQLGGSDPNGAAITYQIVAGPTHGQVEVDRFSGRFNYAPEADYFGSDTFSYVTLNTSRQSKPAAVIIRVQNVNDAPTIESIPNLENSAYELKTSYPLSFDDVDGDTLQIELVVKDAAIAKATFDAVTNNLIMEPLQRGETSVAVEVRDGELLVRRDTSFIVKDVTKIVSVTTAADITMAATVNAIVLQNSSDRRVDFDFSHNGFPTFKSDADIVEYVRFMPPSFEGEPFERKLWRFVRNSVYHWVPLTADRWHYDPWVIVNSFGWAICDGAAATYVRVARAAGYEARVWGLFGHVVPEIKIGDRWQMFDPDLSVYYRTADGAIAGVSDLTADPALITSPVNPVLDVITYQHPYSVTVADIYASADDNYIAESVFMADRPREREGLQLPPGGKFIYPGNWTTPPIGYDGDVPYEVPSFLQGKLIVPTEWRGSISTPWLIAEIQGQGLIRIRDQEFIVGSAELAAALKRDQRDFIGIDVIEASTPIQVIMFMNAISYEFGRENNLSLSGLDVWAIESSSIPLPLGEAVSSTSAQAFRKPRPVAP